MGVATMENSMEGPQEIKIELQYNPAILLLGFYMEIKITLLKRYCTPMFIMALSTITKTRKQCHCPLTDG